jgi:hypothetical protein
MDKLITNRLEVINKKPGGGLFNSPPICELTEQAKSANYGESLVKLCSSSLATNPAAVPKLLKCVDSFQAYIDAQNMYLNDYYNKCRESLIIQLGKSSSDLKHRHDLQALQLIALNNNDLNKASLINSILNQTTHIPVLNNNIPPVSTLSLNSTATSHAHAQNYNNNNNNNNNNQLESINNTSRFPNPPSLTRTNCTSVFNDFILDNFAASTMLKNDRQSKGTAPLLNARNVSLHETIHEDDSIDGHLFDPVVANNGDFNSDSNDMDSIPSADVNMNGAVAKSSNGHTSVFTLDNDVGGKMKIRYAPLSPIRHLICSPGLETTAYRYRISILYRGACNGQCYQNKPWSNQVHLHYIVNTVNCNDHISRLVKKQGIQFYNSFVLQNPERLNQLIQLYKMEKVKQHQ